MIEAMRREGQGSSLSLSLPSPAVSPSPLPSSASTTPPPVAASVPLTVTLEDLPRCNDLVAIDAEFVRIVCIDSQYFEIPIQFRQVWHGPPMWSNAEATAATGDDKGGAEVRKLIPPMERAESGVFD